LNTLIQGLNRELLDWIPLKGSNQFTLCVSHCPGKYGSHSTKTQIQKDLKFLKNNNIPYFLKSDFFSSAFSITPTNVPGAMVKLLVPEDKKEQAENLIINISE